MISERCWRELSVALAQAKHSAAGARAVLVDREFIEAVLWLARTGSRGGIYRRYLASGMRLHTRFQRWKQRGVWRKLWQLLQQEEFAVATKLFIDSTTVRAHQSAAGAPKKRWQSSSGPLSRWTDHQDRMKTMPPPCC